MKKIHSKVLIKAINKYLIDKIGAKIRLNILYNVKNYGLYKYIYEIFRDEFITSLIIGYIKTRKLEEFLMRQKNNKIEKKKSRKKVRKQIKKDANNVILSKRLVSADIPSISDLNKIIYKNGQ